MDQTELAELTDLTYAAATDPARWSEVLDRLGQALNAPALALLVADMDRADGTIVAHRGFSPELRRGYDEYYGSRNVWLTRGRHLQVPGRVTVSEESCPEQELVKTEFYNDFLRHLGVRHAIGGTIVKDGSLVANLTAQIQAFLSNLASFDCSTGAAVQGVSSAGFVGCTPIGALSLTVFTVRGYLAVGGWGGSNSAGYACPAGYTLLSGGYSHWPLTDYHWFWDSDYASYTTWQISTTMPWVYPGFWGSMFWPSTIDRYDYNYGRYIYIPFKNSRITNDYVSGNSYNVAAETDGGGYYQWTAYVDFYATCARLQ